MSIHEYWKMGMGIFSNLKQQQSGLNPPGNGIDETSSRAAILCKAFANCAWAFVFNPRCLLDMAKPLSFRRCGKVAAELLGRPASIVQVLQAQIFRSSTLGSVQGQGGISCSQWKWQGIWIRHGMCHMRWLGIAFMVWSGWLEPRNVPN